MKRTDAGSPASSFPEKPAGNDHGRQDPGAVQRAVGLRFGEHLHGQPVDGGDAVEQLGGNGAAVQVDHACRRAEGHAPAEDAVHQREEGYGQRDAEGEGAAVGAEPFQLDPGYKKGAEHVSRGGCVP